ncbi:MAG: hypothetical protein U0637_10695 [Phycisphaerales bacterium]
MKKTMYIRNRVGSAEATVKALESAGVVLNEYLATVEGDTGVVRIDCNEPKSYLRVAIPGLLSASDGAVGASGTPASLSCAVMQGEVRGVIDDGGFVSGLQTFLRAFESKGLDLSAVRGIRRGLLWEVEVSISNKNDFARVENECRRIARMFNSTGHSVGYFPFFSTARRAAA